MEEIRPAFTEKYEFENRDKVFHDFSNYSHFDARNKMNDSSLKSVKGSIEVGTEEIKAVFSEKHEFGNQDYPKLMELFRRTGMSGF